MNRFYFLLTLLTLTATPELVLAHGASIEYEETSAITIQAKYDDGKPMANAQVVIYAPRDPANPWLKGKTDANGNFSFVPNRDVANTGNWDVKVRQSGHGDITSIPIDKGQLANNSQSTSTKNTVMAQTTFGAGYTFWQKIIMAVAVGWGCVGTALFFSRSQSN